MQRVRRIRSYEREGTGLQELRARIAELLPSAEELGAPPEPAGVVVHRIEGIGDGFAVEVETDGAFRVRGKRIERVAAQTNFEIEESAEQTKKNLKAAQDKAAETGDAVSKDAEEAAKKTEKTLKERAEEIKRDIDKGAARK